MERTELERAGAAPARFVSPAPGGLGIRRRDGRSYRVAFGAVEKAKEECRDARRIAWLSNVTQDLRYAIRAFRHAPDFIGLVFLLALGMGANLATFSVADAILLRMLPVRRLFRSVEGCWIFC
jgi:hypothetical protein